MKKNLAKPLRSVLEYAQGKETNGCIYKLNRNDINVLSLRNKLGYSQSEFAMKFGFSIGTLKNWEQERREPVGSARSLLKVIEYDPDMVEKALAEN